MPTFTLSSSMISSLVYSVPLVKLESFDSSRAGLISRHDHVHFVRVVMRHRFDVHFGLSTSLRRGARR